MISLTGTYADECNGALPDRVLKYACRCFIAAAKPNRKPIYIDGVGTVIEVSDGDALVPLGDGTWFALYTEDGEA